MKKRKHNRLYTFLAGLLGLVYLSCTGPRYVTLHYPPTVYESIGLQQKPVVKLTNPIMILLHVDDKRETKERIGKIKNSYGKELGNVLTINDPVQWLASGLKTELEKRRYIIFDSSVVEVSDSIPLITVSLDELRCDAYWIYEGKITITVRMVLSDDSTVIEKTYTGRGSAGENFGGRTDDCAKTLALTLSDAVYRLADDLHGTFINRYMKAYRKSMQLKRETTSARTIAYTRGLAHGRSSIAARAAAIAKAVRYKQIASSSRTSLHSKSKYTDKSKSWFRGMAEKLSGKRDTAELNLVFKSNNEILEKLCEKYWFDHPQVKGNTTLELMIDAQGKVTYVNVIKTTLKDTVFQQQIADNLKSLKFSAIENPGDVTLVLYHIAFGKKAGLTEQKEIKISLIIFTTLLSIIALVILSKIE